MSGPPAPPSSPFDLAAHVLSAGRATPVKIALAVPGPARADRWSHARPIAAVGGTATTGPGRLGRHLADLLARSECPRILSPVDTLPRGANNILQRRAPRQAREAEHGQT